MQARLILCLLLTAVLCCAQNFPSSLDTDASLLRARDRASSTLSAGINSSVTTFSVATASSFASNMVVVIGTEQIFCTTFAGTTFSGCTRGYNGTTAAAHSISAGVYGYITSAHHNALKDALIAIETALGANLANVAGATHASRHISTGADPVAAAIAGGASGLMTGADKTKLDGIAAGAEVNVNADWASESGDSQIQNKPTLGSAAALNASETPEIGEMPIVKSDGSMQVGASGVPFRLNALSGVAPDAPASGRTCYFDSADSDHFKCKDTGGNVVDIEAGGAGDDLGSATYADVVALWTTCSGYLKSDGTCDTPSGGGSGVGTASDTLNFGAIADLACADLTFTFTGASVGDQISAGFPSALETGLIGTMWVSATNTVKVRLCNSSGATVDPAAGTYSARLALYYLSTSGAKDFSAISDGVCATDTLTLTGASTGDQVVGGWPAALETGLIGTMLVTASDTVTIRLCNWSGATVDPASGTFYATVAK